MKTSWLASAAFALLACVAAATSGATGFAATARAVPAATIGLRLQPEAMAGSRTINAVQVTLSLPLGTYKVGSPLLRMPLVISNVQTSAKRLEGLQATDAHGPVTLASYDDPPGPQPYRHWVASRRIEGPLHVRYRVPIDNAPNPLGAAPPFELRSEGLVFSGLVGSFVLLPDNGQTYRLHLDWQFDEIGGSTLGVSTIGVGDRTSATAAPSEQWESIYVMGGRLAHEPAHPAPDGFFSAWQGTPPFDARALMQWTHRLYDFYLTFFHSPGTTYSVYLRRNPINPGGGVEVGHSFVGTFDKGTKVADFKLTLAHEMVHTFVGALDTDDELGAAWFSEGLAVYYQRLLPFRAGLISRQAYLDDLNATAARYYTDILNTTPNAKIPARFWPDTRVRVLPYDRGSLYFAQLNWEIEQASAGKRSLDDVLLAFLDLRRHGKRLTKAGWIEAVDKAVGPSGVAQFQAMLHGTPIVVDSQAFGPCFRRTLKPMRRYQLGFTPDVLIEPRRIVRGLIPDSAAAKAGLRDGDEILKPVAQDAIQSDQHASLTLHVSREGKIMDITYLPRGATVPTYQWTLVDAPSCRAAPSPSPSRSATSH